MKVSRHVTSAVAVAVFTVIVTAGTLVHPQRVHAQSSGNDQESRVERGFEIAPVPLNLKGKNRELVGLGSDLVNASMPFKRVRSLLLVTVTVDGHDKTLIFDTGAERTMIHDPDKSIEHSALVYVAGKTFPNFRLIQVNLAYLSLNKLGQCDGVMGQDLIGKFKAVRIDYNNNTVELIP